jgi:hypothetical protein
LGELDFLVGETVVELRYLPPTGVWIVFDRGDRPEPALYASVSSFTYVDPSGRKPPAAVNNPASVGPALAIVRTTVEAATAEHGVLVLAMSNAHRPNSERRPESQSVRRDFLPDEV